MIRNFIAMLSCVMIYTSCVESNSKKSSIDKLSLFSFQNDVYLSASDTIFKVSTKRKDSTIENLSYVLNRDSLIYYEFSFYFSGRIRDKIFYSNDSLNRRLDRSNFLVSYYDSFIGADLFDSIGQGVVSKESELYKRSWFESGQPKISFELISDTLNRIVYDSLKNVLKKQKFVALNDLNSLSVNWKLIK